MSFLITLQWAYNYDEILDAKGQALKRGLPNPIITVAEYLGSEGRGFRWGPDFTVAGEASMISLQFAAGVVGLASVLLVSAPFYGVWVFPLTGNEITFYRLA